MAADAKAPLLEGRSGATPAQTLGNIVVSIVGTGVLGLPYAFRTAGWLAGALGVAAAGASTFYCMLLLVSTRLLCFLMFHVSSATVYREFEFIIRSPALFF
jgi:solute carrier family 36 (proton-coupled amino acid transporter)